MNRRRFDGLAGIAVPCTENHYNHGAPCRNCGYEADPSIRDWVKESPSEYAQRRADETACTYFVTNYGHAVFDTPDNRKAYLDLGLDIIAVFRPARGLPR